MKKIILLLSLFILMGASCTKLNPTTTNNINYTGSYYEGNYIWGGAMNLAWNEMKENIIGEDIKFQTTDEKALEITNNLNDAVFSKNDMSEDSYYVKSGFGPKTVDTINKESRAKFPSKSFADLKINLDLNDFIAYAYFLKEVEYVNKFSKSDVYFENEKVKGFYANGKEKENIKILKYWDDNKFIISLKLKEKGEDLILAKGFDMNKPEDIVKEINKYNSYEEMGDSDIFEMPELHLDYNRNYTELIGKNFANEGWEAYVVGKMFENIKFDMDNKGARVENEAVIVGLGSANMEMPKIKRFVLDKPFWVIMKQSNSSNPYFILGVNNTKLMTK